MAKEKMEREWLHIERVLRACLPNAVIWNKATLTTILFFLTVRVSWLFLKEFLYFSSTGRSISGEMM